MKTKPPKNGHPQAPKKKKADRLNHAAGEVDPIHASRARATECNEELNRVLEKYDCRIHPYIPAPSYVGEEGRQVILSALYGIVPNS